MISLPSSYIIPALLCCALSLLAQLSAQEQNEPVSAPENRVLDKANIFHENPEKLKEVTEALEKIHDKHGYSAYLAIYYNILQGSVQSRADELYETWLGDDKRGLVIVAQLDPSVDGKTVAVSYYRATAMDPDAESSLILDRDMHQIMQKTVSATKEGGQDQEALGHLTSIVVHVEREIDAYFAVKPAKWSDVGNLKLMAVFFGIIALFVLLGTLMWMKFRSAEVKSNTSHYFPEVEVAQRLGAPYGGGCVSEASFAPASSRR